MGRRLLVALAILVAAVGAYQFVLRKERRAVREDREQGSLLRFDDRMVTALELTGGGVRARFERSGTEWRMTSPRRDAAEAEAVEKILQAAKRTPVLRVLKNPETLSSYGLDPPTATLRVETDRAFPVLELGEEDPTRQGVFARLEGRPGVLLLGYPDAVVFRSVDPYGLRDPTLTGMRSAEVVAVTVEREGESVRLERGPDGWWITDPMRIPASDRSASALLAGLDRAAPRALDDEGYPPPSDLLPDPPRTRVILESPSSRREIRFGEPIPGGLLPATRDDRETLMGLDRDALEGLPLDASALADRVLTKANRYRVVAWEDVSGTGRAAAERAEDGTWHASSGATLAEDEVLSYLARVLEASVESVRPGDPEGEAARTVRFRSEGGGEDTVRIGPRRTATLDSLPGVVFVLTGDLPAPPTQ